MGHMGSSTYSWVMPPLASLSPSPQEGGVFFFVNSVFFLWIRSQKNTLFFVIAAERSCGVRGGLGFWTPLGTLYTSNLGENLFAPENGYFYFFGHRFHTRRAWGLVFIYDTTNYTSNHHAFIPTLQTLRIRPQGGVFFFVNLGGVFFFVNLAISFAFCSQFGLDGDWGHNKLHGRAKLRQKLSHFCSKFEQILK